MIWKTKWNSLDFIQLEFMPVHVKAHKFANIDQASPIVNFFFAPVVIMIGRP
jgi:hypothetical protein